MTDQPAPLPAEAPRPAEPAVRRARVGLWIALSLAFAVVLTALSWWDAHRSIDALQQDVARRLADADGSVKADRALALQTQELAREAQARIGQLEAKLAESQNQQVALEALYQELSRNRDEWSLAEVEQIITIANQQLQLAGNVKAALIALQAADTRLQRIDKPQLIGLRRILDQDIERLKAVPLVDTAGIAVRLDNLGVAVETLPLLADARPPEQAASDADRTARFNVWQRLVRDTWSEIRQLVRIQRMDRTDLPLLGPGEAFFLRENLKLRLLSARFALLAHDEQTYKSDLRAAQEWLARFFDDQSKSTENALAVMKQLSEGTVSIAMPDISASLDAVHNYRLTREPAPQ
jgi:uroporphyrin-III C-methyltransferase